MKQIVVVSTDTVLNRKIRYTCAKVSVDFHPVFVKSEEQALEYLNYELPEICVFNFSDEKVDLDRIMASINEDPWIHYGGIIGVHARDDVEEFEKNLKKNNIISLIPRHSLDFSLPRVLRIIHQNRQFIFQREIQSQLLTTIAGSFIIDNDPFDVNTYSNLIVNYLYNANFISYDFKDRLHLALMELLINAIEHGNCRIAYAEKSKWLEEGKNIFALIRKKNRNPDIASRKVYFNYRITPARSYFSIRDEGEGFDWRGRIQQITEKNYLMLHGRGIMMANLYLQNLSYNDKGNEVSFEIEHQAQGSNLLPGAFEKTQEVVFEDGETVFTEGEESNFLYYIVSGKLKIISQGRVLSTLTPADIFLGEMSFLLNDRRSASVQSEGRTVLLRISKTAFVTTIRESPHYGIFLARLLAQRLDRLNQRFNTQEM